MSDREELIQVAAVAVAALEGLLFGEADVDAVVAGGGSRGEAVWRDVLAERRRQDVTWGPQRHPRLMWLLILVEEVGEWVREVCGDDGRDVPYGEVQEVAGLVLRAGELAQRLLDDPPPQ